jgi:hypothetical protein
MMFFMAVDDYTTSSMMPLSTCDSSVRRDSQSASTSRTAGSFSLLHDIEQSTLKKRTIGPTGVDEAKSFDGYVLFSHLTSSTVRLIDNDGQKVHS